MILEIFPLGPFQTNSILLGCSDSLIAAVIDAPFGSFECILNRAEQLNLTLDKVLLTHSHWDHIAEAALFKEKLNLPIYIHPEDAENLKKPGADGLPLLYGIPGAEPDHLLGNHQILSIGNLKLEVIHTPGHSPGCVCFYLENERVLISGDTLFKGTCGNVSFPTSNPKQMDKSLKLLSRLPPDTKVYPGHGPSTTIEDETKWIARGQVLTDE